jgi:hypothetical protein
MNWLTWQQHKKQFLIFGLILAAFAAVVIPTGLDFWHTYQQALATCDSTNSCGQLKDMLFRSAFETNLLQFMKAALVAVPILFGVFWGVPLIAREYNEGTNLLIWTRGVSRRKWLTVKLAWILLATAIVAGGFAALATWWSRAGNALYMDAFQPLNFSVQGIVPVAFAVFAVAVGIALGTWLKRTMVALAITLGLLVVMQVVVATVVRPHYMQAQLYTTPLFLGSIGQDRPGEAPTPPNAGAAWIIGGDMTSKQGQALDWKNPPEKCRYSEQQMQTMQRDHTLGANPRDVYVGRDMWVVSIACLINEGYTWHVSYQPADRYWKFQLIEAGLYLGLAIIPLTATYWLVLRRDA